MVASCKGIILPAKQAPYRCIEVHAGPCFQPAGRYYGQVAMSCVGALHKVWAQAWCKLHGGFRHVCAAVPNPAIGVPNLARYGPFR